jgi:signal peptide peptidase SppA
MLARRSLDLLLGAEPPKMQLDADRQVQTFGYFNAGGVAVLPIFGGIMKRGTGVDWLDAYLGVASVERMQESFRLALADPGVESILLQVDSPGGETLGVFDFADAIYAARGTKPIWAIADESAYSAGYLIASAAERLVMPRAAGVGSIGVYAVRLDVSGLDEQAGVKWDIVEYGARKADGHPHKPETDAERADLQAEVNRLGEMFTAAVARNRGISAATIRGFEARTFHGPNGVDTKLADAVGTFEDTVMELATMPRGTSQRGRMGMSTQATPPAGGNVVSIEEARAQRDAALAEGKTLGSAEANTAERARAAAIKDQCVASGCPELAIDFVTQGLDLAAVAKALADRKVAADANVGAIDSTQRAAASRTAVTFDVEAIYAKRKTQILEAQARTEARRVRA